MLPELIALIFLLSSSSGRDTDIPSHCSSSEQILFNCQLTGSEMIVSLCATDNLDAETGYLQYRYGPAGKAEFIFPDSTDNTQSQFFYNHYFRFQYDLTDVTFRHEGNTYIIYDYYNGEENPVVSDMGININESVMECGNRATSELMMLEDMLACARENANIGNCE